MTSKPAFPRLCFLSERVFAVSARRPVVTRTRGTRPAEGRPPQDAVAVGWGVGVCCGRCCAAEAGGAGRLRPYRLETRCDRM